MLIIVEGPDGSGKTTLIDKITDRHDALIEHHGPYLGEENILHHYVTSLSIALSTNPRLTIMDRCWLSEGIYGPIMRQRNRLGQRQQTALEILAREADACLVFCLPPYTVCEKNWQARLKDEYVQRSDKLKAIYDAYKADYSSWIRRGFASPVILFDYTSETFDSLKGRIKL
jgi:thymidylate kinase